MKFKSILSFLTTPEYHDSNCRVILVPLTPVEWNKGRRPFKNKRAPSQLATGTASYMRSTLGTELGELEVEEVFFESSLLLKSQTATSVTLVVYFSSSSLAINPIWKFISYLIAQTEDMESLASTLRKDKWVTYLVHGCFDDTQLPLFSIIEKRYWSVVEEQMQGGLNYIRSALSAVADEHAHKTRPDFTTKTKNKTDEEQWLLLDGHETPPEETTSTPLFRFGFSDIVYDDTQEWKSKSLCIQYRSHQTKLYVLTVTDGPKREIEKEQNVLERIARKLTKTSKTSKTSK